MLLIFDDLIIMPDAFGVPIKVSAPEIVMPPRGFYLLLTMSQLPAFGFRGKEPKISMSCNARSQKPKKK